MTFLVVDIDLYEVLRGDFLRLSSIAKIDVGLVATVPRRRMKHLHLRIDQMIVVEKGEKNSEDSTTLGNTGALKLESDTHALTLVLTTIAVVTSWTETLSSALQAVRDENTLVASPGSRSTDNERGWE